MKFLSSIIALALASSSAANEAHKIIAKPHIAKLIHRVQEAAEAAEPMCSAEAHDMFECFGSDCINCFVDLLMDIQDSTTCEGLEAGSFCSGMEACEAECMNNDCTAPAEALWECAAENYPAEGKADPVCPDLCEDGAELEADTVGSSKEEEMIERKKKKNKKNYDDDESDDDDYESDYDDYESDYDDFRPTRRPTRPPIDRSYKGPGYGKGPNKRYKPQKDDERKYRNGSSWRKGDKHGNDYGYGDCWPDCGKSEAEKSSSDAVVAVN